MDLRVRIRDKYLKNPVGVASGTFGYGSEYKNLVDLSKIGAIYTKAVTINFMEGNPEPRLIETPAGLLNSIGLANVGLDNFISEKLPFLKTFPSAIIPNIAGSDKKDYIRVVEKLNEEQAIFGFEINLSCPNVKEGCLAFGSNPENVESITAELRRKTEKPLIIKLTPNVTDIAVIARAAENGGADAVSCINTLIGMVVNVQTKKPVMPNITGGLSGPAIRPVGVAMVYKVSQAVTIPVIGIGGIMTAEDALQYLLAGASSVQIGTGNFIDPKIPEKVLEGIIRFCEHESAGKITDLHSWKENWEK
jgi:dihydroorotate dehydrogenase (NAD+) catalytic subunit